MKNLIDRVRGKTVDNPSGRMVIATSCDEGYFPLVKGLLLSMLNGTPLPDTVEPVFLDLGCSADSLAWLATHGVRCIALDETVLDELGRQKYGYHRAQICRPFLPRLFPDADVLAWIDCDTWVQDTSIFDTLRREALDHRNCVLACPEIHYTYTPLNADPDGRRVELKSYYEGLYGRALAEAMSILPTTNSGFFAMHRDNTLWLRWQKEILSIYRDNFDRHDAITRHFGEQMALNKLIHDGAPVRYFDPLYNYLCLWTKPFRDEDGVVRLSAPPYLPLGVLHLAGGWKYFGQAYYDSGLLYRRGDYLSERDRAILFPQTLSQGFR